ncbi:uncharacterized protein BDV17DRAFT_267133 [Aspergillus undulatus]|uniref:uncharacterized protein n=1 Tax=Aspergillus undulatus TaxID=1810928 RepID=UPI003CCD11A9
MMTLDLLLTPAIFVINVVFPAVVIETLFDHVFPFLFISYKERPCNFVILAPMSHEFRRQGVNIFPFL